MLSFTGNRGILFNAKQFRFVLLTQGSSFIHLPSRLFPYPCTMVGTGVRLYLRGLIIFII